MLLGDRVFNENLKKLRLARNMSQVALGKALGVSKQSICNWENDNILPSIDMLIKIASYFSVSTDYLLGIDSTEVVDVSGLSPEKISHIRQIIDDMR